MPDIPNIQDLNQQQAEQQAAAKEESFKTLADRRKKLAAQGHIADPRFERLNRQPRIEMPMHPDDMNGEQSFGIPEDWDYKTSEQGPFGEKLPDGAVSWKPDGTPWYGTSSNLSEWAKGLKHNLWGTREQGGKDYLKDAVMDFLGQNKEKGFIGSEISGFQNLFKAAGNIGTEAGERPSFLAFGSRLIGQSIMGAATALGEAAEFTEKQVGGLQENVDQLGETSELPEFGGIVPNTVEDWKHLIPEGFWQDSAVFLTEALDNLDAVELAWNSLRAADAYLKGTAVLSEEDRTANLESARIAYSNWINPAQKEEYKRRFIAGANPYLLEQEMMNPVAELAGQLIFDPLNVVGFAVKGYQGAKAGKTMQDLLTTVGDEFAGVIRHWDEFSDLSKADDLVKASQKFIGRIRGGLTKTADQSGLAALTTTGKRAHVNEITGQFVNWVTASLRKADGTHNIDETMEVLRAVYMMSSDNADEVGEAVAILGKMHEQGLPLGVLFSEGSGQTSIILRSIADNVGGFDEVLDAVRGAENSEDLLGILEPATNAAVADLFPTLQAKAATGAKLTMGERALLHVEDVANSRALTGVNKFFAHIYMGMSPGYVARNALTNFVHVFLDEGPEVFRHGVLSQIFRPGKADDYIKGVYGYVIESAKAGIGPVGGAGVEVGEGIVSKIAGQGLKWGQKAEIAASKQIVAASTRRMLRKMLRPGAAIPDISPLVDEGMDLVTAKHLQNLLIKSNGNVKAAEKLFRSEILDGGHDLFRAMGWIDPADAAKMDDLKLLDELKEIVSTAGTKADAQTRFGQFIDNLLDDALEAASKEMGGLSPSSPLVDDLEALRGSGTLADDLLHTISDQKAANQIAQDTYRKAVHNIKLTIKNQLQRNGSVNVEADLANMLNGLADEFPHLRPVLDDSFWKGKQALNSKFRDPVWDVTEDIVSNKIKTVSEGWHRLGLDGEPPAGMTLKEFKNHIWEDYFHPRSREFWTESTEEFAGLVDELFQTVTQGQPGDWRFMDEAAESLDNARLFNGTARREGGQWLRNPGKVKIEHYRQTYNIEARNHLKNIVNKFLRGEYTDEVVEGARQIELDDLDALEPDTVREALRARLLNGEADIPEGMNLDDYYRVLDEQAELVDPAALANERIAAPIAPDADKPFSPGFGYHQQRDEILRLKDTIMGGMDENWGLRQAATEGAESALKEWFSEAGRRTNTMRFVMEQEATAKRNFALLDYGKRRNFDSILGLIYPYNFWYSRTYPNWMARIAKNPSLLAGYGKYRRTLENLHAGMPDWWKYNVNTNELFGLDSENPLFFNLEATLNPLNGITGVDFDDPYKKTGWWTQTLADMNRFGPSTHTALSWVTGLALYAQGEKDAASRWIGRLGSFTAAGTAIKSLAGLGGGDVDPLVRLFSGKTDAYTMRRVNRMLYQMVEDREISAEEALDAARLKEGDIWDDALDRAVRKRAPGQLGSYFFGVGFKPRTMADMEVDQAYNEYFGIMGNRENMTPAEFRQAISEFQMRYPQMDTVLVGMKNDDARDAAYAWAILGRIPPGASYDFYKSVGLDERVVEKWYDSKGSFEGWGEADRNRFMAAIVDMAAVLAVPDNTTKADWTMASVAYSQMTSTMKQFYGEDILDEIDLFYEIKTNVGEDEASRYLEDNPMVAMAMDFKTAAVVNDPHGQLAAYYSGLDKIQSYYKGQMYNHAEQLFGAEIFDTNNLYWSLEKDDRKSFLKEHPELKKYWQFKRDNQAKINQQVVELGALLPEGAPALLRPDFSPEDSGVGAQSLHQDLSRPQDPYMTHTPIQWQLLVGDDIYQLALDALEGELTSREEKELEYQAKVLGIDVDRLIQYIGISQYNMQNSP